MDRLKQKILEKSWYKKPDQQPFSVEKWPQPIENDFRWVQEAYSFRDALLIRYPIGTSRAEIEAELGQHRALYIRGEMFPGFKHHEYSDQEIVIEYTIWIAANMSAEALAFCFDLDDRLLRSEIHIK